MGVVKGILLARNAQGLLESLFFKPNRRIAGVDVDVIFDYSYTANVNITENPVENGVLVNDHRIIRPRQIVMNVGTSNIVTTTSLISNPSKDALLQAAKVLIFGNQFDSKSRIAATYQLFESAMMNGEVFDLETPFGTFKNMLIHTINSKQDSESISTFEGSLTMRELITYETLDAREATQKAGVTPKEQGGQARPSEAPFDFDILPTSARRLLPPAEEVATP